LLVTHRKLNPITETGSVVPEELTFNVKQNCSSEYSCNRLEKYRGSSQFVKEFRRQ